MIERGHHAMSSCIREEPWQDVDEGDRVLLSYETCYPYETYKVAEVTTKGVSILADFKWMESMKGWE